MKMPTAVLRHRIHWKPGEQVSYTYGNGNFSREEDRLPMVGGTTANSDDSSAASAYLPLPLSTSAQAENMAATGQLASALSSFSGQGEGDGGCGEGGEAGRKGRKERKRFPILGPTRQDAELYFRRRRQSAKRRAAVQPRSVMTRSADRVVPASTSPTRRVHTTTTATPNSDLLSSSSNTTSAKTTSSTVAIKDGTNASSGNGRYVRSDGGQHDICHGTDVSSCALPVFERGTASHTATPSLPHFERVVTCHSAKTSSSLTVERLDNSPERTFASLPLPTVGNFHGQRVLPLSYKSLHNGANNKTTDFSTMSLAPSSAELLFGPGRLHRNPRPPRDQQHKVLQPSKHGYHTRNRSPTFKRLVEAAERLEGVVPDFDSEPRRTDKGCSCTHPGRASPTGVHLPAVAGACDDLEEGQERKRVGDDDAAYLYPHDFLASLPYSAYRAQNICDTFSNNNNRSRTVGTSMADFKLYQLNGKCRKGQTINVDLSNEALAIDSDPAKDLGGWEVDSLLSMESVVESPLMKIPTSEAPSMIDNPTELHLFLPRLADAASEENSSKTSPDWHRQKNVKTIQTLNSPLRNSKDVTNVTQLPKPSQRSQHSPQWAGDRNGKLHAKRYTSPVRAARRDKTPNIRRPSASLVGNYYESYEPFIKGEHLKEKLEDVPTLISLDQD